VAGGSKIPTFMSNAKIFLISENATGLQPMTESTYVTEGEMQRLLADYPDLIPGDQVDPENPRRWWFVGREVGIPAAEGEGGWWSLDHLFIDQESIPTFIECKRASDSRTRREVVAQMLDYAANGTAYWTADRLRQVATGTYAKQSLDEVVAAFAGIEVEAVEGFWRKLEENLRAGKVRLIFVTDEAPRELRRMTEFLNEQMRETEVLLVEIKQFKSSDGLRAMVPRLIGQSTLHKPPTSTVLTTEPTFIERCAPEMRPFFEQVLREARERGYVVQWGTVGFSVRVAHPERGSLKSFFYGYPPSEIHYYFEKHNPLTEQEAQDLRQKLLSMGLLRASGERTLRAELKPIDLPAAREVWKVILEHMEPARLRAGS
jgi:hypothetical protein